MDAASFSILRERALQSLAGDVNHVGAKHVRLWASHRAAFASGNAAFGVIGLTAAEVVIAEHISRICSQLEGLIRTGHHSTSALESQTCVRIVLKCTGLALASYRRSLAYLSVAGGCYQRIAPSIWLTTKLSVVVVTKPVCTREVARILRFVIIRRARESFTDAGPRAASLHVRLTLCITAHDRIRA